MISLKSIKVYEGMSEETHCFEANLYVDNKKLGRVSNSPFDDEGCHHNLETYIGDLLTNHLEQKDLKKLISSSVVVVDDNCSSGEAYRWNFSKYKSISKTKMLDEVKKIINKDEKMINPIILNSLPFDIALKNFYK